ncbi:MAG: hypothetical protein KJZ93_10140 [Caldilineaceae bacterium]|nr:hypothetical protein [Caldilineaceae bacterium]
MQRTLVVLFALMLVVANLLFTTPVLADDAHGCMHEPTIQALRDCVSHAVHAGHITNQGVANSLLAKLDAAQAALDRGQSDVAINNLKAFVRAVEAQAGKHVVAEHAAHMATHAQHVIDALRQ